MRNRKNLWIILLTFLFILPALALPPKLKKISVPFIKNEGQTDKKVSFYAKTFGGTLFVTKEGRLIYSFPKYEEKDKVKLLALEEVLLGAKVKEVKGTKKSITKVNYFIGNDPKKWRRNISTYEGVTLGEVYEGITLTLRAYGNNVEKIFRVKPFADPDKIKLSIKGAKELKIDKETGELVVITELGEVRFTKPVAYQKVKGERKEVKVSYKLIGKNSYAFVVGEYDRSKELVIDPLLASTYLGGSGQENRALSTAINMNTRDIYVVGYTSSTDFPTVNPIQLSNAGGTDIFVSKFSYDLSQLLTSTYIGTSGGDEGHVITIDSGGNVIIGGVAGGANFPGSVNNITDSPDGIVAKLSSDLSSVISSRYLDSCAGTSRDIVSAIAVDSSDNIYVAGTCVPLTKFSGGDLNTIANSVGLRMWPLDMAIDSSGNIYIVGGTSVNSGITTTGVFQENFGGGGIIDPMDGLIRVYDSNFNEVASSYLGGSGDDWISGIAIDSQGNLIVVGTTASNDIHTKSNPNQLGVQSTFGGQYDIFVSKVSSDLTTHYVFTYLGGSDIDVTGYRNNYSSLGNVVVDGQDNVYIVGMSKTSGNNFPTTTDAFQPNAPSGSNLNSHDVIITKLNNNLTQILASTFFGGSGNDLGKKIRRDSSGNIIIAGITTSTNIPISSNAYDNTYNGSQDVFVARLTQDLANSPPLINSFSANPISVLPGSQVTFSWNINDADGDALTCQVDVNDDGTPETTINNCTSSSNYQYTYNQSGIYTAKLIVDDGKGNPASQTIQVVVNTPPTISSFNANPNSGNAPLQVTFSWQINDADGDALTCQVDVNDDGTPETTINNCTNNSNYQHTYNQGGNYTARLIISDGKTGGTASQTVNVSVNSVPQINSFSANPTSGNAPLKVTFSWDINDGDGDTLTCKIDVDNDGKVDYTIQACTNNSTQDHTYKDANTYTVKLIVEDGKGGKVEKTLQVVVKAVSSGGGASQSGSQTGTKKGNCSTVTPQTVLIWMFVVLVPLANRLFRRK